MNNILHIYANGDWCVERPHATGSDFGPAHYGKLSHQDQHADRQIAFYSKGGFEIRDARAVSKIKYTVDKRYSTSGLLVSREEFDTSDDAEARLSAILMSHQNEMFFYELGRVRS